MHKTRHLRRSLTLRTETVRSLTPGALAHVAGGDKTSPNGQAAAPRECSTDTWTQRATDEPGSFSCGA